MDSTTIGTIVEVEESNYSSEGASSYNDSQTTPRPTNQPISKYSKEHLNGNKILAPADKSALRSLPRISGSFDVSKDMELLINPYFDVDKQMKLLINPYSSVYNEANPSDPYGNLHRTQC